MNTIIEILVDNSQSMGISLDKQTGENNFALSDGSTKMSLVKKILINDIIPTINHAKIINLRTFRFVGSAPEIELLYNGNYQKEEIDNKIESIADPTTGKTPIAAAVNEAVDSLKEYSEFDKKIFLLTDGHENVGGDYKLAVKKAIETDKIPCQVFVIGIDQDQEGEIKSKEIASISDGIYINLKKMNYDADTVSSKLSIVKRSAISGSISTLATTTATKAEPTNDTQIQPPQSKENQSSSNDDIGVKLENSEGSEILKKKKKKVRGLESLVENYSNGLTLVNKQLQFLSDEIGNLKRSNSDNYEENEELNEKIRLASEQLVFELLNKDYPERVKWLNETGETYNSYDFQIINSDGTTEYYIECKATMSSEKSFLMTALEWTHFLKHTKNYQIYFVAKALSNPQVVRIDNLFEWILNEKIVPYGFDNKSIKGKRIQFTIL